MSDKSPEELLAAAKAELEEQHAAQLAEITAKLAEESVKREAAEKATRKTAAELQKLQVQRKAADAGMTEEKLRELREEARAELLAEYQPELEKAKALASENRALKLDTAVKAMAAKAGILPEKIGDFWKLRGDEFDLTDDGKPMVKGKPGLTPEKHLDALKALNPEWVAGSKAAGSGAGGSGAAASGGAFDGALRPEQRLAMAHEAGLRE